MGMGEVVMVLGDQLRKISPISLCWGMSEKLPISAQEPGPSLARGTQLGECFSAQAWGITRGLGLGL